MNKLALLYITNGSVKEAKKIARHLLKKRIIGCANIFPINALFWWKGKIVDGKEVVLIAKTTKKNCEKVRDEVARIHPFETPCIIRINADPNEKYFQWINSEIE